MQQAGADLSDALVREEVCESLHEGVQDWQDCARIGVDGRFLSCIAHCKRSARSLALRTKDPSCNSASSPSPQKA